MGQNRIGQVIVTAAALTFAGGEPAMALPPGYTVERTGGVHDFDYFRGGWNTEQHRLADALHSESGWQNFTGILCMKPYLDGIATVDELYFPTKRTAGLTVRTFDREKHQWSIYWVSSTSGRLDPDPVVGGFQGNRGEFYAPDKLDGRPIKVRYLWIIKDRDHARWEQAFSFDDHTWQTNWTADFTRADTAQVCEDGRPRR
jgi:hypothetical protein